MKIIASVGMISVLALSSVPASAHDEFRFVGTVTKLDKASMVVKAQDPKPVTIKFNGQTIVTKDKNKVQISSVKEGDSVVVDALGDSYADLLALEVRIVPPIGKPK